MTPTVNAISPVVASEARTVLSESRFYSATVVNAVEQKRDGTPSGTTVYAAAEKPTHHRSVADLLPQPEPAPFNGDALPKEKMAYRLKTSTGQALYKLRKQTVEPVFGIIKEAPCFRPFRLCGREQVSLEWTLACVSYKLKLLFTLKSPAPARRA